MKKDLENQNIDQGKDAGYEEDDEEKAREKAALEKTEKIRKKKEADIDAILISLEAEAEISMKKFIDQAEDTIRKALAAEDEEKKDSVDAEDEEVEVEKEDFEDDSCSSDWTD